MTGHNLWATRALYYARQIATRIGPRGAATPEEKQAADYAQQQMQRLGLSDVHVQSFKTPAEGWLPITIIFSIAVWAVFGCWILFYLTQTRIAGGLLAAGLCAIALVLLYLEVTLRNHPVRRWLTRNSSFNALGQIPPAGVLKQRVLLISQLDTPPASAVLKTPRRARLFGFIFYAGAISLWASVVLYVLGGLDVWDWAFVFAGICGVLQSAVIIQSLRADHGEFTPGANYNASGLGTILALAERLRSTPLINTEVWIACCGSHIARGSGVRALLSQHTSKLHDAWFIGFEGVGIGDRLSYVQREGWLRHQIHPAMRQIIERAVHALPEQPVAARTTTRNTVVAPATWHGYKSVCLCVYDEQNSIPQAFNAADTADHLQLSALTDVQEFGWQLLHEIDSTV